MNKIKVAGNLFAAGKLLAWRAFNTSGKAFLRRGAGGDRRPLTH